MSKAKDPFIGRRIREYEVLGIIGRGGMGAVYRARHVYLDKERAIKVIHSRLAGGQDFVQRFIREAKILSELDHPNLVHFYEFGQLDEEMFFMVMEMIHGETVIDRIQAKGKLPPGEAFKIIREAAMGLASAHQKGIIHRDISPDNLLIVKDQRSREITKVVDFGIAKPLAEDTGKFTVTNFFIGKPEYSSPEQCGLLDEGQKIDHRSDIYSLCVTLYQMITGSLPFYASTPQGYILKHAHQSPKPPSSLVQDGIITSAMDSLLLKGLAKNREDRFQSMQELIHEMDNAFADESPTLTRISGAHAQVPVDATLYIRRPEDSPNTRSETISLEDDSSTERITRTRKDSEISPTAPLKRRKSASFTSSFFWILLAFALTLITAGAGYYAYQKYNSGEDRLLLAAEKSINAGDPEEAENQLNMFETRGVSGYETRVKQARGKIEQLRYSRRISTGQEILKSSEDYLQNGNTEQASELLNKARAMQIPELQGKIDSLQTKIASNQTEAERLKEAQILLNEIQVALSKSDLETAKSKLRQYNSSGYKGAEKTLAGFESKIKSIETEQAVARGEKTLDQAESLMKIGKLDEATRKIDEVAALKLVELDSKIKSLSARVASLKKQQNDPAFQKAKGLLLSAELLIERQQYTQASRWISRARAIGIPELEPEIIKLNARLRAATAKEPDLTLEIAENALRRGNWILAQRIVRSLEASAASGQEARIDQLKRRIDELRPYVGFGVRKRWDEKDRQKYRVEFGAVVGEVQPGSPAAQAGLRKDDVILEYDGIPLSDEEQLPWLGAYAKPGSVITLVVLQNGVRRTINIRVDSMAGKS